MNDDIGATGHTPPGTANCGRSVTGRANVDRWPGLTRTGGRRAALGMLMALVLTVLGWVESPAALAAPNTYSEPTWFPLRSTSTGLVGCTYLNCDNKTYHGYWALDFMAEVGTPVYAAGAGQVTTVRNTASGCSATSNSVLISHDGKTSYYTHLDKVLVKKDDWVDTGTQIGTVGRTGLLADGCHAHLHYEERNSSNQQVDPGPMRACLKTGEPVSYPNQWGTTSWADMKTHTTMWESANSACGVYRPVTIRSKANNQYVSAEIGTDGQGAHYGKLRARATSVGAWERFTVYGDCRSSWGCSFLSNANNKWVSVELGYQGDGQNMLRARADVVGQWERFELVGSCGSTTGCAIKSKASNRYVASELGFGGGNYGMLRANRTAINTWERFEIPGL